MQLIKNSTLFDMESYALAVSLARVQTLFHFSDFFYGTLIM